MFWTFAVRFFWVAQAASTPILWRDIRVVDARGDQGIHDVWIQEGRIAGLNPSTWPEAVEIRDGTGLTLTPGMIDSHVHITQHPGAIWLTDIADHEINWHRQYLRSYLAWGITTLLIPGLRHQTHEKFKPFRPVVDPDIQLIGPLVGPKHGYPSAIFSELEG